MASKREPSLNSVPKAGNRVWSLLARDSYGAEWRLELECLLCGGLSCWSVSEHILRAVRGLSGSDVCVRLRIRVKACSH